ncbi:hypothetical protein EDD17DRAFT_1147311 [Pisolithus thermaeus]|nr:hypothetical protein EDD17DRAFT_1147311 [Pisolithus thermaeus]
MSLELRCACGLIAVHNVWIVISCTHATLSRLERFSSVSRENLVESCLSVGLNHFGTIPRSVSAKFIYPPPNLVDIGFIRYIGCEALV